MNDLKPCPFCDGIARIREMPTFVHVGCDACHADGPAHRTLEQAVAAWNRRVPQSRLAAQLRECAATLGIDRIDEHQAMRAYADSMALLAEIEKEQ